MVEYGAESQGVKHGAKDRPLLDIMVNIRDDFYCAINAVREAMGRNTFEGTKFSNSCNVFLRLGKTTDYAYIEAAQSLSSEADQSSYALGGIDIKNPPWQDGRETFVAKRNTPRDIEIESMKFYTEMQNLLSSVEESQFAKVTPQNQGSPGDEMTVTSQEYLRQGTFLVSLNNGRPKKKEVTLSDDKIHFRRPSGNLSNETAVPSCDLLIIAQRSGGTETTTLTIFWCSPEDIKSPTGLEAFKVESAEIFFDDAELLKTWQLGLGRFEQLAVRAMLTIDDESKTAP